MTVSYCFHGEHIQFHSPYFVELSLGRSKTFVRIHGPRLFAAAAGSQLPTFLTIGLLAGQAFSL